MSGRRRMRGGGDRDKRGREGKGERAAVGNRRWGGGECGGGDEGEEG